MRSFLLLGCLFLGCSHTAGVRREAALEDALNTVAAVESVGQAISAKDSASAAGTDLLFELQKGQALPPMAGWITVQDGAGWVVRFIRADLPTPSSAVDIRLGGVRPQVTVAPAGGEALPPEQASMWRARQQAIHTSPPRCGKSVNPVVLKASIIGQTGWLVYLLNPATQNGQIVIGGHVRLHLSADGQQVLGETALSRSCLVIGGDDSQGRQTVAAVTNQVDGDVPHETTVAESLRSKKDIFVSTPTGKVWKVSRGRLSAMH